MAGHSKWANIRHRKGRADAKKGKIISRCAKEIISAVKCGGSDPKNNPRLRIALQKAKENNVSNEVIDRNISKGMSSDQEAYTEMLYELYGHGGVGVLVEIMTDNRNRIASDIRIATNKRGGTVATPGSVLFNFDKKGVFKFAKKAISEETLFLASSDAGAEDFSEEEEYFIVTCAPECFAEVQEKLKPFSCTESELTYVPKSFAECEDTQLEQNALLIEWLEEIDDVDAVYNNMR